MIDIGDTISALGLDQMRGRGPALRPEQDLRPGPTGQSVTFWASDGGFYEFEVVSESLAKDILLRRIK